MTPTALDAGADSARTALTATHLLAGQPLVRHDANPVENEVLRLERGVGSGRVPVIGEHRLFGMISEADVATS